MNQLSKEPFSYSVSVYVLLMTPLLCIFFISDLQSVKLSSGEDGLTTKAGTQWGRFLIRKLSFRGFVVDLPKRDMRKRFELIIVL